LAKSVLLIAIFGSAAALAGQFFDLFSSSIADDSRLTQGNRNSDYCCVCYSRKEHRGSTVENLSEEKAKRLFCGRDSRGDPDAASCIAI